MGTSKLKSDILAGRDIFEKIPNELRPGWAKSILLVFDSYIEKVPTEVSSLISLIDDKSRWKEAHGQFSKIRQFLLTHKSYQPEAYLLLAENVAKVTYNASGEPAPFDNDSGWWIPSCALQAGSYFKDTKLQEKIMLAISGSDH